MASLYDRTDIYDLLENEDRFQTTKTHWQTVFAGKFHNRVFKICYHLLLETLMDKKI